MSLTLSDTRTLHDSSHSPSSILFLSRCRSTLMAFSTSKYKNERERGCVMVHTDYHILPSAHTYQYIHSAHQHYTAPDILTVYVWTYDNSIAPLYTPSILHCFVCLSITLTVSHCSFPMLSSFPFCSLFFSLSAHFRIHPSSADTATDASLTLTSQGKYRERRLFSHTLP